MDFGLNLRRISAVALLLALTVPMLAACGSQPTDTGSTDSNTAPTAPAAGDTNPDATTAPATDGAAAGGETSDRPGELRFSISNEPDSVDPQQSSFSVEIQWVMLNYQALMGFDKEMTPVPGQAESVELSADGKTYTFKLRPDSKYSDGSPLTAQNFEYAWKRLADPLLAGEYQFIGCGIIKGYSEYASTTCQGKTITEVEQLDLDALRDQVGITALDDQTLQIELVNPAPYFLSIAALWVGVPTREQDAEDVDALASGVPENYIGNGPFVLVEHEPEARAVWEPNPYYVGPLGPVKLERLEMQVITESQIAFEAYNSGELDMIRLAPEDLAAVEADPMLSKQLVDEPGSATFYMGFNNARAPFDEPKVRQAFAQAFDREGWVRDILKGLGNPSQTFIPPGFPGHQEGETRWAFDPDKAKATLAEAGYPNGEGLPEIRLTYSTSTRNQTRNEWIANQLKQNLGISVVLDPIDPTAYTALFNDPETTPQLFLLGWSADFPDPQSFLTAVFKTGGSASARISWSSQQFDELVTQADVETDPAKRADLYKQAQDLLVDEAPVAFLWSEANKSLVKPYVKGIEPMPLDYFPGFFSLPQIEVQ